MSNIDERLRVGLKQIRETVDEAHVFEQVASRKSRRTLFRRVQLATLAAAVILGSVLGTYGLLRVFRGGTSSRPTIGATNGLIVLEVHAEPQIGDPPIPTTGLYTVSPDGADPQSITPGDADYFSPSWSPDGKQIAFVRVALLNDAIDEGMYLMNSDGTGLRKVYSTGLPSVGIQHLRWSPDGSRLGFVRSKWPPGPGPVTEADEERRIFVVNADGTDARPITHADQRIGSFSWSPGGESVVFWRESAGPQGRFVNDLFVMNVDGTEVRQLTHDGSSRDPAWSPDGELIAFVANEPGTEYSESDLYVMTTEGTGVRQLTDDPATEEAPEWAPDGTQILFGRFAADGECGLVLIGRSGGERRVLVDQDDLDGNCPSVPDWQAVKHDPSDGARIMSKKVGLLTYQAPTEAWEVTYSDRFTQGTIPPPSGAPRVSVDGIWIANFDSPQFDPRTVGSLSREFPNDGVAVVISQVFGGPARYPDQPDSSFPISVEDLKLFPGDQPGAWWIDSVVANGELYNFEVRVGPEANRADQKAAAEDVSSFRALALREGTAIGRHVTFFVLGTSDDYPMGSVTEFDESSVPWPSFGRPFPFYLVHVPEGFYALSAVEQLEGGYQKCDVSFDPVSREFSCPNGARWAVDGSVTEKPGPEFPDDPLQVLLVRISLDGHVLVSPNVSMSDTKLDFELTGRYEQSP